jgi:YfiH family protein
MPMQWLIPQWDAPKNVHAVMTTRHGGCSTFPYDSMNLGSRVGDEPQAVARNRALLASFIQCRPVWLDQVHGCDVLKLHSDQPDGMPADGCVSNRAGMACAIAVADCLPLLFTNRQGTLVGAVHAGWRGLAGERGQGVVEAAMALLRGDRAGNIQVWLGPCIGQDAFEVGVEVRDRFIAADDGASALFQPGRPGKFHADLQGLARRRLAALGVHDVFGNDGSSPWCTYGNPSMFFSHRRDQVAFGGTGRNVAAVWLD